MFYKCYKRHNLTDCLGSYPQEFRWFELFHYRFITKQHFSYRSTDPAHLMASFDKRIILQIRHRLHYFVTGIHHNRSMPGNRLLNRGTRNQ